METTWSPPMSAEEQLQFEALWDRLGARIAALEAAPREDPRVLAQRRAEREANRAEMAASRERATRQLEHLSLWNALNLLEGPGFEAVVQRLQPPEGVDPGPAEDQWPRTSALLRWAEQASGPGLAVVRDALEQVAGADHS